MKTIAAWSTSLILTLLLSPALYGEKAPKAARPPFSIAFRSPAVIRGTPGDIPLAFTVTDLLGSRRAITFTNALLDASGKAVWGSKAVRLGFQEERSLGVSVTMTLPALPPGRYTLVSSIPDAIRAPIPDLPPVPDAVLTLADKPAPDEPLPPQALPPPFTVDFPLTLEEAPARAEEPFALAIDAPPALPSGPLQFEATVTVTRVSASEPDPVLVAELIDARERVFWREERPLAMPGPKAVTAAFTLVAPALPAGSYFINARVRDSSGRFLGPPLPALPDVLAAAFNPSKSEPLPRGAVRKPLARLERFTFDRDLLWGTWDSHELTRQESEGVKAAGINTGRRFNYNFPYRWFVDHDPLESTGLWPEDAFKDRKASALAHYQRWMGWAENDPGFAVMDMYDELGWSEQNDPAKSRLDHLMAWRSREKMPGVSTITAYNGQMQTDHLGWDEVLREGFPQASGPNAVKLKWAFQAWTPTLIRLRMEAVRELNPGVQLTPGMGAGLLDPFYDSMHNRAYNKYTTTQILGLFTAGLPAYGTLPWSWLINLKPPFEQCSRITWASLAAAGRFFPVYCPGDGYGDRIVNTAGVLTASGAMLKQVNGRIQPLAPVLLAARNRIETEVLYFFPGWATLENGLFEGLLACGIQPDCSTNLAGRKLLVLQGASGSPDRAALVRAVQDGAGLVFTPDAGSNAASAFGLTLLPAAGTGGASNRIAELDLSSLKEAFPGLDKLRLTGTPGGEGVLAPGSPLQAIRDGGRTLAWTGALGKGWVLCLNASLPLNRPANGALMRALLDRAGLREPFRFADETGAFHSGILGVAVETADRSQSYVIAVTESKADVQSRFYAPDPALRGVRDLCAEKTLDWKQDRHGRFVEVNLPRGVGTLLALLTDPPGGSLAVSAPAAVAGGETLSLALARMDANGTPLRAAHSYEVRVRDAAGNALTGLSGRATGPSPVRLSIPVARSDPDGPWTLEAVDLTDGTTASAGIVKTSMPETGTKPPPRPPEPAPPFALVLEGTPPLEGDVILVTLKGRATTTRADAPEVTIEPAVPAACLLEGPARLTLRPKPDAPAAFAFTYRLSRAEAQSLRGGRNQGVPVRLTAPGFDPVEARWRVPVNPFQRAPQRIGTVTGGRLALRVDNVTGREREVTLAFDPHPGWAAGPGAATKRIASGVTAVFEWPVVWEDPVKLDPGLSWIPLRTTVDGLPAETGALFLEQDLEQNWRIGLLELKPGDHASWDPAAEPAAGAAGEGKRTWTTITAGTVLDWPAVAARLFGKDKVPAGVLVAVTDVRSPEAKKVRIGFAGPTAPARILLNGAPVEADWESLAKTGGVRAAPVDLRKGLNTVTVEILLPVPDTAATSLVLQDLATGRLDRSLSISIRP